MFDTLYNAIDLILPFQWLSHTFMKMPLLPYNNYSIIWIIKHYGCKQ